ncbi:hypothetical protein [Methanobacterium sp.]|uniref:hypothetical protein n=1 Tax=Methanobacterium sp. TaxID=2164 RepID=UPI003C773D78
MKYRVINWNFEMKEPANTEIVIDSKVNSFKILKDEDEKYVVTVKKDTSLFILDFTYEFDFRKDKENLTDEQKRKRIVHIITFDSSSLCAIFMKYSGLPPIPLLIDLEEDDEDNDKPEDIRKD